MQQDHFPSGKCKTKAQARGDLTSAADGGRPSTHDTRAGGSVLTFKVSRVRSSVWDSIISIASERSFRRRKRHCWFPVNWYKASSLSGEGQNPNLSVKGS